jgi:hypothetical protein
MVKQSSGTQYSLQALAVDVYILVFLVLDILTSLAGVYNGMPSSKPVKLISAIAFAILITAGLFCTRIIFDLDDSNQKQLFLLFLSLCIGLDAWTSFEGLHHFITPVEDDIFGWFLLIIATLACSAAPIIAVYSNSIKNKMKAL